MSSTTYGTREEWLLARRSLVTASDVAAILGVDPHRDALSVYADKIGAGEQEDSLVMRRGRRFEAAIAEEFAEQVGVSVVDPGLTIFRHRKYEWLGATLDRYWVRPSPCALKLIPVQIKLGLGSYGDWKNETPKHYQVQVLTEAAVVDAPFGTIAGLIGPGPLAVADIMYDAELFELIVPRLREFLDRVERRDPPEPTSGLALEPIRRIFTMGNGETVELSHLPLGHTFEWAGDDPRKDDGIGRCGHPEGEPDRLGGRSTCWKTEPEHAERYAGMANEWERAKAESKRQDEIASGCQAVLRHQLGSAQWAKLSDGTYLERKINKAGADSLVRFRPKRKS